MFFGGMVRVLVYQIEQDGMVLWSVYTMNSLTVKVDSEMLPTVSKYAP
jgi:hypothetical protein